MKIIEEFKTSELREIEEILEDSYNYERVRMNTVNSLSHDIRFNRISERASVLFCSTRYEMNLIFYKGDEGLDHCFEVESHDLSLEPELAFVYKRAFVRQYIKLREAGEIRIW